MIKKHRHMRIIDFLKNKPSCLIEEMAQELNIPMTTFRRDIKYLEQTGVIKKLRGGIEYVAKSIIDENSFTNKLNENTEAKKLIAKHAIQLVKENESIFLDSGSHAFYVAKYLPANLNLKVVTNSIYNVLELTKNGHGNVYLLGGKYKSVTGAILGFEAIEALKNYSFDKAFIGVNAIDNQGNLYTTNSDHAQIKIAIINKSEISFALVDASKHNRKSFYIFANDKKVKLIK